MPLHHHTVDGSLGFASLRKCFLFLTVVASCLAVSAAPRAEAQSKKEVGRKILTLKKRFQDDLQKSVIERNATFVEIAEMRHDAATQILTEALLAPKENAVAKQMMIRALGGDNATKAGTAFVMTQGFDCLSERNYHIISASFRGIKDEDAIEWLAEKGWKHLPALKLKGQLAFLKVLVSLGDDRAAPAAKKLIGQRKLKTAVQVELVKVLTNVADASVKKKVRKLYKWDNPDLMVAILRYGQRLKLTDFSDLMIDGVESQYWQVRAVACNILGETKDPSMLDRLIPVLEDRHLTVQVSAVHAIRTIGGETVIEPLYKALDKAQGRVQDDLVDALIYLTGKNLGTQSISWEGWWSQNKGKVEIAGVSREEFDRLIKDGASGSSGMYYGLRVLSKNVTFVLDVSGSMQELHKIPDFSAEPKKTDPKSGSTGVGGKDKDGKDKKAKKYIEKPKIELAKRELRGVLGAMAKGVKFNIIQFSGIPTAWQGELIGMDEDVLEAARKYVDSLGPGGTTNVYDSLLLAMEDPTVDTVYFLSDGAPTAGTYQDTKSILEKIAAANEIRKVKIHTIGFKLEPAAKDLMKKLAEENHGSFVDI